ncbi:MAG: hypothetical protein NTW17_02035 [Candidatus Pacearchaeota archaeon]|nr:hypothetical protein [Candidatus Pacearchaeota archaeon]
MTKTGMGLETLKKEYEKLQKQHKLPGFEEMNKDFYVEKIAETETDLLIREIRRMVGDRLANYMRLIENLLNPVNVPMFVFSILKMIGSEEKKKLTEVYKQLVQNEIKFVERDLEFDETKEAEFIRNSYNLWQGIKKELAGIFEKVEKHQDNKAEENNKGYFG